MGADCTANLPGNVRCRYVAYVIAKCAGAASRLVPCAYPNDTIYLTVEVDGVAVEPGSFAEAAHIKLADAGQLRWTQFSFDFEGAGNTRMVSLRSCAAHIALARRLVEFFGGTVDYDDGDSIEVDYEVPAKSDDENQPLTDEGWLALQERIHAVPPLTAAEIKEWRSYAAYQEE